MPYTKDSLPDAVKKLPAHAQAIWMSAFNSAFDEYNGDEGKSNATAWSAIEKAGYKKNEQGEWVKAKEEKFESDDDLHKDEPLELKRFKEKIKLVEAEKISPHIYRVQLMNLEEPQVKSRGWSDNDRYYTDRSLKLLAGLLEGKRAMATGHHDDGGLRDTAGFYRNIKKLPGLKIIEGELKIVGEAQGWLEPLIQEQIENPQVDLMGLSINAKGAGFIGERNGKKGEIIETATRAKGCDIVFEPAAGGKFKQLMEEKEKERIMGMTLEELKEERPDLVAKLTEDSKKEIDKLQKEKADLEKEKTKLAEEKTLAESKEKAQKLITESKLNEKQASGLLRLMIGQSEEEMKKIIEERIAFVQSIAPPVQVTNLTEKDAKVEIIITETERNVWKQQGFTEEKMIELKKRQLGIKEEKKDDKK